MLKKLIKKLLTFFGLGPATLADAQEAVQKAREVAVEARDEYREQKKDIEAAQLVLARKHRIASAGDEEALAILRKLS